jgi:amidohydrolase
VNHITIEAQLLQEQLVVWRRQLHRQPEIGLDLPHTMSFVEAKLEEMGYAPKRVGNAGIVATLSGKTPGKCFLLRADMDALPFPEQTELPYRSDNGYMHACGHDFHTTMLLGAAKLLKQHEAELNGTVKLMFQGAEETLQGAQSMIAAGVLEHPKVDAAAMIHVLTGIPRLSSGLLILPEGGVFSAASDWFEIQIEGKGGHGAIPEGTIDPLNIAAHIHIALQEIHARELSAADNAVLTIGMMAGGTTANVIPDTAVIKGTIRTFNKAVRQLLHQRMEEIADGTAKSFRGKAVVEMSNSCPSAICDNAVASDVRESLGSVFGAAILNASQIGFSKMNSSEDFAFVTERVPSVILLLSAGSLEEGYIYPMHHPKVMFNEAVLSQGAATYAIAAMGWLAKNG